MEWTDEGVLLSMRRHGESAAIIEVFSAAHGRHLGVVRGGASRKMAAMLQPGSQLALRWRARLDDHLGVFTVEPLAARAGIMADALALAGLNSICALLHVALPEREAHLPLWTATMALLARLEARPDHATHWVPDYLRWEMLLLEELGWGLDLTSCAVTGSREDLAFVSPKSGRAVSRSGAGMWAARLLPLPPVLLGQGPASPAEAGHALALTGHFLDRGLQPLLMGKPLPEARARLLKMLATR
jgi:DNA repair protein RecO (recombination protein O)